MSIRVDEPVVGEVIVPALEVVKARFAVVVVAAVAQGIDVPDEGGIRGLFAVSTMHGVVTPRAVVVGRGERAVRVQQRNDVALRIEDVVVERRGRAVVVDHGERLVAVVVHELEGLHRLVNRIVAVARLPLLAHDLAGERGIGIGRRALVGGRVDLLAAADTGHVVGIGDLLAVHRCGGELAALRPREGIVLAVVVIGAVGRDVFDHQVAPRRDDDPRRVLPVREVVVEAHVLLFNRHDLHFTPLAKSAISRHRLESC